jgi:hypothetical protein
MVINPKIKKPAFNKEYDFEYSSLDNALAVLAERSRGLVIFQNQARTASNFTEKESVHVFCKKMLSIAKHIGE